MKKTAKILIAASAVAAVVGVGTASYAMWSGGSPSLEVNGSIGEINVMGDLLVEVTAGGSGSSKDTIAMDKLLPYDMAGDDGAVTYWQFSVTVEGGTTTPTVSKIGTIKSSSGGAVGADLYYSQTAPGATASDNDISSTKEITLDESNQATVYVYMVAYRTDAMNASISLTFTAT